MAKFLQHKSKQRAKFTQAQCYLITIQLELFVLHDLVLREPESYSTFIGADKQDNDYATGAKKSMDSTCVSKGTLSLDEN